MHFNDFEAAHFNGEAITAHRLIDLDPAETRLQVTYGPARSGGDWRVILWVQETGEVRHAINVASRDDAEAQADQMAKPYL